MAVKYAIANGNWSAGATWNGGTIPQEGDYVYASGKTIQIYTGVNIGNGTLSTEICPNTGLGGGTFSSNATTLVVVANLHGYNNNYVLTRPSNIANTTIFNVTGNIYDYGIRIHDVQSFPLNINGNIYGTFLYESWTSNYPVTRNVIVNGNVYRGARCSTASSGSHNYINLIINGLCELDANMCAPMGSLVRITINGRLSFLEDYVFSQPLTISGILDLSQTELTYIPTTSSITFAGQTTIVADYPPQDVVKKGVRYGVGLVGTYDINQYLPPESVVLKDYEYGDSDDRKTGTMEQDVNVEVGCVTPEDVRKDVPLVGMGVVGSLIVPSVDDVREGVVFDNGSVGTLIVQGGGDRLRIANFGYYTNAQSDTYIVDLTEQDKPKFAVAEERVLIEMFPDLDLENIPDKYFDDLFVKYLKYRLIVEYYRTAGINSTFTPSEPTTEIVNYQNVRNEVWLNSANIYLKAWGKKYPESITKPQRILL